ncbi:site-specific integrase [Clostridia bacterium]|nr:site-specific integrase [Clostridia bacterium]
MSHRHNGEGTYYRQPNGTWQYKITVGRDADGKLIRKTFYGKTNREAKAKADVWTQANGGAVFSVSPETKLSEWLTLWLENTKKGAIRDTSYKLYKVLIEKLPAELKKKKVSAITPIELQSFVNRLAEKYSNSYLNKMCILLRASFIAAVDNGLCAKSPAKWLVTPKRPQNKREAYTVREAQKLTAFALNRHKGQRDMGEKDYARQTAVEVLLMLYTGLRRGELLGLTWPDIQDGKISVNRALFMDDNIPTVEDGQAKSGKSIRVIPLPEFVYNAIDDLPRRGMYIFCAADGTLRNPSSFGGSYRRFMEAFAAENPSCRKLSAHCLRHTYATLALSGGADIRTVQELLGHENINTTAIYTHPDYAAKQTASDGVLRLLSQDTKQDTKPEKAQKSQ